VESKVSRRESWPVLIHISILQPTNTPTDHLADHLAGISALHQLLKTDFTLYRSQMTTGAGESQLDTTRCHAEDLVDTTAESGAAFDRFMCDHY
jgi:hypothetical protein